MAKYIMFEVGSSGWKVPIIFPDILTHRKVANAMLEALRDEHGRAEVLSAGFCKGVNVSHTGGASETLKVESSLDDTGLINRSMNM